MLTSVKGLPFRMKDRDDKLTPNQSSGTHRTPGVGGIM